MASVPGTLLKLNVQSPGTETTGKNENLKNMENCKNVFHLSK